MERYAIKRMRRKFKGAQKEMNKGGVGCCVEIKVLRRVRAESSRRPPRIDATPARWRTWRCGLSPLDSAGTAAFSPRKGFDID